MNNYLTIFVEHPGEMFVIFVGFILVIATLLKWRQMVTKPWRIVAVLLICFSIIFNGILRIMIDLQQLHP